MSDDALIVSGQRQVTRGAMLQRVRRAASGFAAMGIGPGDCVALRMRNDIAFLEASLAASGLALLPGMARAQLAFPGRQPRVPHGSALDTSPPKV